MQWYVIKEATGQLIARCGYLPDPDDLASRGEIAVEHPGRIELLECAVTKAGGKWVVSRKPPEPAKPPAPSEVEQLIEWAKAKGFNPSSG